MWPVMEQKLARFRELEAQLEDPAIGELLDRVIHAGGRSAVASA